MRCRHLLYTVWMSQIYDTLNMHLKVLCSEKDLAESSVRIE
jgi:hypothetical protein